MTKENPLEQALEQLDLQGIIILQGVLAQKALDIVLKAQQISSAYKPYAPPSPSVLHNQIKENGTKTKL